MLVVTPLAVQSAHCAVISAPSVRTLAQPSESRMTRLSPAPGTYRLLRFQRCPDSEVLQTDGRPLHLH